MSNKNIKKKQVLQEFYEWSVITSLFGTFACLILSLIAERDPEQITHSTIGNPDAWVCLAILSLSYFVYGSYRLSR